MEDNKLVLLAIQQTLDENTEVLKKIQSLQNNESSVENIQLDIEPISEILNQQFNNTATLLQSHLDKVHELSNDNKALTNNSPIVNKTFSLIGISSDSKISPKKLFIIIFALFFIFCTTWVGLHYWYSQGYKIKDQFSAYKTIQTIKYKSKKSYSKNDIISLYNDFEKEDKTKNEFYNEIESKIINDKKIEDKKEELNNLKNKK